MPASPRSSPDDREPIVVAARRTPIGRAGGALAEIEAADLAACVIRALIDETAIDPAGVHEVVLGNAAGGGGNIARLAALSAGLPIAVPGTSVDRQCGAGLEAIVTACRMIQAGAGDLYLAGGVESVSRAPWRVEQPRRPGALPRFYARARFAPDAIGDPEMGAAAENVARAYKITRSRQDAFALRSHERAIAAMDAGRFEDEIVAVATPAGSVRRDECPRRDTSLAALARLQPAFAEGGSVTAGNACPLNDGAAIVLVATRARAREAGYEAGLAFVDAAAAGVDPNLLGIGPVASTGRLLARRPDLQLLRASAVEFNEAFASQVLASLGALGVPEEDVNRDGGAIALGHPFGASGAILVTRLFAQLVGRNARERSEREAFAMLGIAGGLGLTAAFRPVGI
ncbi:MAG: thiolase family protein [Salinarimonas sp.]